MRKGLIIILLFNTLFVWSQDPIKVKPLIYIPELTQNDSVLISELANERKSETLNNTFIYIDDTDLFVNFPGGDKALYKFLAKNLTYPDSALKYKIEGKVMVSFVIDNNGGISNIKITKGLSPDIDQAVLKLISSMPNWIWDKKIEFKKRRPTMRTLPISFNLK